MPTTIESFNTTADTIEAPSEGAVKVKLPLGAAFCSMAVGKTVKFPLNEAGWTTATETLGGWFGVPDCTQTPERLVTRSE